MLNVSGVITNGPSEGPFSGPVDQWTWIEGVVDLATTQRFDTFIFWGEGDNQLDRLAEIGIPAARQQFAART